MDSKTFDISLSRATGSKVKPRRRWRKLVSALAVGACLTLLAGPGRSALIPDTQVYLYNANGSTYATIGYSVIDGHVTDPFGDFVGDVDDQGNIWDADDDLVGFVEVTSP